LGNFYPFLVKPVLGKNKPDKKSGSRKVLREAIWGSEMAL
jgi:hypothetical protein